MRYTINLDCKTHHISKDGKIPVLLRIFINGAHGYLNTGKRIKAIHYNAEDRCIKPGVAGYTSINSFIDRQKVKIDAIINGFEQKGEVATISKVKEIYARESGKVKSDSFYEFVEETIEWERFHTKISEDTLANYEAQLKKLKTYRKKLTIHDIDKKFLEEYKAYILEVLKQADNTAYHAMCFLRKYAKKLFEDGKISPYPFAKFQVGSPYEVDPEYLELEELNKLHDLYDSKALLSIVKTTKSKHGQDFKVGEKYQEILRYFLVACYTGLRHSDIKTLRREHVKGNFIVKTLIKGREGRRKTTRIPIRKRLVSLLDMHNDNGLLFQNSVMENSQTNVYLKAIMPIANIDKHITFHCARHSFAIISLLLGIKIEVVSDILGHSELTTTQRYARVVDRLREQEMDKWDKLVKDELVTENQQEIICPDCENTVLRFEKGSIALKNLPVVCPYCSKGFNYKLHN